ncbi:MAG: L-2-hydroxyglutarate oxidase [Leptolyngbyaceae cyanobacterium MO_188.B28]|nr:L-2-hydroxyglutarate oxidase [Leptolyngbyaceae cyanobacterium MO_188.B28]
MVYDIIVIGGGIVGLASALKLFQNTGYSVLVIEAEETLARHQTGHNSGVIHSGLYYKPGSLKAKNCVDGRNQLYEFCQRHEISVEQCGKIVLATTEAEAEALRSLMERGRENGLLGLRMLSSSELVEFEPHARGILGLLCPETGIVNYREVSLKYAELIEQGQGEIKTNTRFISCQKDQQDLIVQTNQGEYRSRFLINCGGLQADRIAKRCGVAVDDIKIIPFRGEYYELNPDRRHLVKNLIYPVPDPRFPFLGVHFTRRITGEVEAGPNAVFAFKREGYRKTDFSIRDTLESLGFPGFWKIAFRYRDMALREFYRSVSKAAFVKALQRMMPELTAADLHYAGAGVRAQAVLNNGRLLDDFCIKQAQQMIHVLNAPSPAATASLSIGDYICDLAIKQFIV